ncbi:MAG: CBS domain-containing protein [Crocinitomicaceae bacterium]
MMRVKEIMSSPVICKSPSTKLSELKSLFKNKELHAAPITETDGTIAGIITSSDLIAVHNETLEARQILTPKVHICLPNNRVKDAANTMAKHNVHHMVVMEEGKVIGMISSMDIVKVYANSI